MVNKTQLMRELFKYICLICSFATCELVSCQVNIVDEINNSGIWNMYEINNDCPNVWYYGNNTIGTDLVSIDGNSLIIGQNEEAKYTYSNNQKTSIIARNFSTTNFFNLKLSFDWKCNGEKDHDYGTVCYSLDNGANWTNLKSSLQSGSGNLVTNEMLDLPDCASNSSVLIGFYFENDESFNFQPGLVIDNVVIYGTYCPNPPSNMPNTTYYVCFDFDGLYGLTANSSIGVGNTLRWYNDNNCYNDFIHQGDTLNVPLNSDLQYRFTRYNLNSKCESVSRSPISLNIRSLPSIHTDNVVHTTVGGDGAIETTLEGNSSLSASWYCESNGYNSGPNASEDIYDLEAGTYIMTVSDAWGCDSIKFIEVEEGSTLIIPAAISPNGDGLNDQLDIIGIHQWEDFSLEIFNLQGTMVYRQVASSAENPYTPWNGCSNIVEPIGEVLPDGDYFFYLKSKNKKRRYKGVISIKKI